MAVCTNVHDPTGGSSYAHNATGNRNVRSTKSTQGYPEPCSSSTGLSA